MFIYGNAQPCPSNVRNPPTMASPFAYTCVHPIASNLANDVNQDEDPDTVVTLFSVCASRFLQTRWGVDSINEARLFLLRWTGRSRPRDRFISRARVPFFSDETAQIFMLNSQGREIQQVPPDEIWRQKKGRALCQDSYRYRDEVVNDRLEIKIARGF